jgi:hypothetical protein
MDIGTTVNVEGLSSMPMAMYVSKNPVSKSFADLPVIARLIYPLVDVKGVVDDYMNNPIRLRTLGRAYGKLHELNYALKLAKENMKPYEADVGKNKRLVEQRSGVIIEINQLESVTSSSKLEFVDEWAIPYVQMVNPLTAYRVYHYLYDDLYKMYVEVGVDRPRVVIVMSTFDDYVAKKVVERWCG